MIRFLFRFLGLLCLAGAFILVIYDGMKSIAGNAVFITNVRALWDIINASSLQSLKPLVETRIGPWAWDPIVVTALTWPSWAVLGVFGIVLIMLGRKRKPLIGYAR
ncbi:MAG: hypothetical protein ACRECC_00880 [Pseudolabrys sp.]|jgi:hypothetical protein